MTTAKATKFEVHACIFELAIIDGNGRVRCYCISAHISLDRAALLWANKSLMA